EIDQLQIEDDARRIEDAEEANRHVVRPMDREADQRSPRAVERTRESIAQRSDGSSTDLVLEAQALRQHEELASIDAAVVHGLQLSETTNPIRIFLAADAAAERHTARVTSNGDEAGISQLVVVFFTDA